ncbi:MAG: hypothetical protein ACYSWX_07310 [Planctomycetota bacterium]|jgi:hypothetical protein
MGSESRSKGCHGCRHFRVTYDPAWPYACDLFDMRAKRLPSIEVLEASGQPCRARETRDAPARREPPAGGLYA